MPVLYEVPSSHCLSSIGYTCEMPPSARCIAPNGGTDVLSVVIIGILVKDSNGLFNVSESFGPVGKRIPGQENGANGAKPT